MPHRKPIALLRHIRGLAAPRQAVPASDRELLGQFSARGDEGAFAELVRRHGAMVLRACRRVLGQAADAEDVWQATFLVLASKAPAGRWRESVGAWLYEVAYRLALKARAAARRRETRERQARAAAAPDPLHELSVREAQAVFDQELAALPETYRAALILCCLEGLSRDEAARQLGWPLGRLRHRLERGRALLRSRLTRRGLTLPAALLPALLAPAPGRAVASVLAEPVVKAARALAAGEGVRGVVAPRVAALAEGATKVGVATKARIAAALVLSLGIAAAGLVAAAAPGPVSAPGAGEPPSERPPAPKAEAVRPDRFGDPLPPGALARLGTRRLRHALPVASVSFSPDGKTLASAATLEAAVQLWDAASGKSLARLKTDGPACAVAFAPDGKTLAVAALAPGGAGEIQVWDAARRERLRRFDAGEGFWPSRLVYSPDGKVLASAPREPAGKGAICLWDAATGRALHRLEEHVGEVHDVAFSPDGKQLASAGRDGRVILWDVRTGGKVREFKDKHGMSVAFTPDGKQLLASGNLGVWLWEVDTGKDVRLFETRFGGTTFMALSPDGKTLAASSWRYDAGRQTLVPSLLVWDVASGRERAHHDRPQTELGRLAFSPDGKALASAGTGGNTAVLLWDAASGKPVLGDEAMGRRVCSVAFSPDGRVLATGERLWDAGTGKLLRVLQANGCPPSGVSAFSAKGKVMAVGSMVTEGRAVSLWDLKTGKPLNHFAGDRRPADSLGFSADGSLLAGASHELPAAPPRAGAALPRPVGGATALCVRLWDVARAKEAGHFEANQDRPGGFALSPDGKTVASGGNNDGSICLREAATGKELRRLRGHSGPVNAVAFSPDGRALASGAADRTVGVWDLGTGKQVCRLKKGHGNEVYAVAFSPDGRTVASGGADHAVCVWEVATGQVRRRFEGHDGVVRALAFAGDGRRLASGSDDGTALVWDVTGRVLAGGAPSTAGNPEALWLRLGAADAGQAYQALWNLVAVPGQAVALLKGRLRPAPALDESVRKRYEGLADDLDANDFSAREKASEALAKEGELAVPVLRARLRGGPSAEARRRIEELLEKAENVPPSGDRLRALRALEVLEYVGTPQARRLLEELAGGAAGAWLTHLAKAAVGRLASREKVSR